MRSLDEQVHQIQIRSVQPETFTLIRRFEPETEAAFILSDLLPPHMYSPHGDVSYVFEKVTSLSESQQ